MTTDLSGPYLLAVPLFFAAVAAFVWYIATRPAKPTRFQGYAVRRGWQVDPIALLDQELKEGRLTGGIVAIRDSLLAELSERHALPPHGFLRSFSMPAAARRDPVVSRAFKEARALEATYAIAFRAEDPLRTDVWSRWRRPVWRARARERFQQELSEVEALLPLLEKSP